MRKFTKGLLMTFVATAMSLGAYAQVDPVEGYFRVINAGANKNGYQVVKVTSETSATLKCTKDDAITLPGTVMYIKADPADYSGQNLGPYIDTDPSDLEVANLRSQGVDASEAVYGDIVKTMKDGFKFGLQTINRTSNWNLTSAQQATIIENMFEYMKMFMQPCDDKLSDPALLANYGEGAKAYYLKSTTPNTQPLADVLTDEQKAAIGGNGELTETLWDMMYWGACDYYLENDLNELLYAFQTLMNRIHMGHTYYLSAGYVQLNESAEVPQTFIYNEEDPHILFANNNTVNYDGKTLIPEIDFMGDYSKWIVEPIIENTDKNYTGTNYFAVNASNFMKGLNDDPAKYYTTLFVDFPMEIKGEGMRVWGISGQPAVKDTKDGKVAVVTTVEYKDVVPARQGVVIECSFNDNDGPAGNCLQPVLTPTTGPSASTALKGQFFPTPINNGIVKLDRWYAYDEFPVEQLRVLSKKENVYDGANPIGFYKFSGKAITDNKAFLKLDSSFAGMNVMMVSAEDYADGINEAVVATDNNGTMYDLQGRQVSNPTKGLYIVNGKKMVIK